MTYLRTTAIGVLGALLLLPGLRRTSDPPRGGPAAPERPACRTGCSLGAHDVPELSEAEFLDLVRAYAAQPMDGTSPALEALLFHGATASQYLDTWPVLALDDERRAFLEAELARRHAIIEFRVVTDSGVERFRLAPTRVPLGVKHHLQPTRSSLPPLELNGTVKRVGLAHLWTRF